MRIGVPRELKDDEYRVAMTPAGVRELTVGGQDVFVERGAGAGSSIPDGAYQAVGASIVEDVDELWDRSELICKVKEPIPSEFRHLREDLVVFTYFHLAASKALTEALVSAKTTAIAYETVQLADGTLPLLAPMSEIAGRMAPIVGAEYLQAPRGGRGVLMSGVSGVAAARVVVIGAGVAGSSAVSIAAGMHADVVVLDRNLARLRALDAIYQGRLTTLAASGHAIEEACLQADLVVGAVLIAGARAPHLLSDAVVAQMQPGSVLVDLSVDQGGCFESSRPTTHSNPTFHVHDSTFYCVANMPGAVPHTGTYALANATLPYTVEIAHEGWKSAARADAALALGVNTTGGVVTCLPVAEAHGLAAVPLEAVLG